MRYYKLINHPFGGTHRAKRYQSLSWITVHQGGIYPVVDDSNLENDDLTILDDFGKEFRIRGWGARHIFMPCAAPRKRNLPSWF